MMVIPVVALPEEALTLLAAPADQPLCQALVMKMRPGGKYLNPPEELYLWAVKCMDPAAVAVGFMCDNGHAGRNIKCDAHAIADGEQYCGYCAELGVPEPVPVTMVITPILGRGTEV
jgi:hypothetical protein